MTPLIGEESGAVVIHIWLPDLSTFSVILLASVLVADLVLFTIAWYRGWGR